MATSDSSENTGSNGISEPDWIDARLEAAQSRQPVPNTASDLLGRRMRGVMQTKRLSAGELTEIASELLRTSQDDQDA